MGSLGHSGLVLLLYTALLGSLTHVMVKFVETTVDADIVKHVLDTSDGFFLNVHHHGIASFVWVEQQVVCFCIVRLSISEVRVEGRSIHFFYLIIIMLLKWQL